MKRIIICVCSGFLVTAIVSTLLMIWLAFSSPQDVESYSATAGWGLVKFSVTPTGHGGVEAEMGLGNPLLFLALWSALTLCFYAISTAAVSLRRRRNTPTTE